ncbi:MAG: 2-phosphosulfolactate phosphatase [Candidatus Levyibacteriota bacterium]
MEIKQLSGVEGAKQATGATVIIDIVRAATVEAYAFGQGAEKIIAVSNVQDSFLLKKEHPEYLLMGEEHGIKVPGFDYGNSPTEIAKVDLTGKTLVHRTTSGTQGLNNAVHADELIFGSFVTGTAVFKYLKSKDFPLISIVSMDGEDIIFAYALEDLLKTGEFNKEKVRQDLYNHQGVQWFFDVHKPEFPPQDIDFCLDFDRFDFMLLAKKNGRRITMLPQNV